MESIWFWLVAFMIAAYVVLDGFDIGAGILYPWVAKQDTERQLVLRSIGPVWDGNEVWLLAAGGTLYFAFPGLYASAFSGFYLPLHMVLWLLILRAIGIEFRMHLPEPVWRGFFDGLFMISSTLLAIFFGAALGNVIRGVPLRADGFFFEPLWTHWGTQGETGILDWYTVLCGVVALIVLGMHGALYLALKNHGELNRRCRSAATYLWVVVLVLTLVSLFATTYVRPDVLNNYKAFPVLFAVPAIVFGSLFAVLHFHRAGNEKAAFVGSCIYIAFMLVGAAAALFPVVLPSSGDPSLSLTIANTKTGDYSLKGGLVFWSIGMVIALGYFIFIYRFFRGKVSIEEGGYH